MSTNFDLDIKRTLASPAILFRYKLLASINQPEIKKNKKA